MQTHQDYLEAPYQDRYADQSREEAAVEEFGDEEAAQLLREEAAISCDDLCDWIAFGQEIAANADAIVSDDEARRARAAEAIGREAIKGARAWLDRPSTERKIWERCVKRAEAYR